MWTTGTGLVMPFQSVSVHTMPDRYVCRHKNIYDTPISRKVVGKSARNKPERYCGWFWADCFSKKFERMAGEAVDICLRVLKESNKSRFDSYSVRNSVLIISHITFRDCRVHMFSDNLSRNSCIQSEHGVLTIYTPTRVKILCIKIKL